MDRIDRDHFLDFSTKSKNFILPKHIQLLRCGSPYRENLSTCRPRPERPPAIRWSVAYPGRGGHGSMARGATSSRGMVVLLRGWDPNCSIVYGRRLQQVVETRRLELLTLSLQRRCSTS